MKMRSPKATGSFTLQSYGSLELIIHMEADPRALSFARFDFGSILPPHKADAFHGLPAYLLRHEVGVFVIAVKAHDFTSSSALRAYWGEADRILASRNVWLFATTSEALQSEPAWSNAQRVARCARAEVHHLDEARVVDFLHEVGQAPLIECVRRCEASEDSCDAALKLVSAGVLHFDASEPLSLNSVVRLHPFEPAAIIPWIDASACMSSMSRARGF